MPFVVIIEGAEKGPKFNSREEALEGMWNLLKDKMSKEEFDKTIVPNIKEV